MSGGVTERSRLLAQLTDTLESVKSEMEERGAAFVAEDENGLSQTTIMRLDFCNPLFLPVKLILKTALLISF